MEYFALGTIIFVCIILPVIVLIGLLVKEKNNKVKQMLYAVCGALVYFVMQWGIKEKGLQWLYNNKKTTGIDMNRFSSEHYMLNLFLISFVGALFLYGVSSILFKFIWKKNYSFQNVIFYGLGYCMTEAVMLAGIRSIDTIILLIKGTEGEMATSVMELFLSAYERVLVFVIEIALLVVLAFMIQKKQCVLGTVVTVFTGTLVGFLPAFFIAFSTVQYLELYSRNVALIIVYVFLSVTALTGCVILWNLSNYIEYKNCIEKKTKKENKTKEE